MASPYDVPSAFPMQAMPIGALQPPQGSPFLPPVQPRPAMGAMVNPMQVPQAPDLSQVSTNQLSPFGHPGDTLNQLISNQMQKQNNNSFVNNILAMRFQPTQDDELNAYKQNTAALYVPGTFKATTANDLATDRAKLQLAPYTTLASLENASTAASGGSTAALASSLMQSNPQMFPSMADALYFIKGGANQGLTSNNGQIAAMPGAPGAKGQIKYGEKMGEQGAILGTAADIERQKKIGAGEITDIDKQSKGKQQVSTMIGNIGASYDNLDKLGGAVNTDNSGAANMAASFANSPAGQSLGKTFGTKTQSARNQIEQSRPLLINAIRQATGMSAKAMDSNTELQFYLKAATDPTLDIQANKYALKRLDELYGAGNATGGQQPTSPAPSGGGWSIQRVQ